MTLIADALYTVLEAATRYAYLLLILLIPSQVFLSMKKRKFIWLIPIALSAAICLYWSFNPLPSWRQATPNMTAMNILIWLPITLLLLIIHGVCRLMRRRKSK